MVRHSKTQGLTLVELIVVISIFIFIFAFSSLVFGDVIGRNSLRYYGYRLIQDIRETRMTAIAKNDSSWGIYFDDLSSPDRYILFRGNTYSSRDVSYDRVQELPQSVHFERISLDGAREISFSGSEGTPNRSGVIVMNSDTREFNLSINSLGLAEYQF